MTDALAMKQARQETILHDDFMGLAALPSTIQAWQKKKLFMYVLSVAAPAPNGWANAPVATPGTR